MRKWLLFVGLVILVATLYIVSLNRDFIWILNKRAGIPISPRVDEKEVAQLSTNSIRGQFESWKKNGELSATMKKPDGSTERVDWKLTDDVSVECMEDIFKAPDGTVIRRSSMLITYKEGSSPEKTIGKGVEWLRKNTKKGGVLWIFGDRTNNQAGVVYLFKDRCD